MRFRFKGKWLFSEHFFVNSSTTGLPQTSDVHLVWKKANEQYISRHRVITANNFRFVYISYIRFI